MDYRIAASINQGGKTYTFSHYRQSDGKAIYKLTSTGSGSASVTPAATPKTLKVPKAPSTPQFASQPTAEELASLPEGAILHNDFVGRFYRHPNGKTYRNPPEGARQLSNGQWVLVPVN